MNKVERISPLYIKAYYIKYSRLWYWQRIKTLISGAE